ncbi:MAG: polysaccharide deacetylase family protein [Bacteroidales bacterium]|nr:polysaccharide deacetylase family protein [Bacteroidales bacterium]
MTNYDRLIQYLSRNRTIISPKDFVSSYYEKRAFQKNMLLITFDDGFLSSYEAAVKILSQYNIKAVFFIPTKILELNTDNEMYRFTREKIYLNVPCSQELSPSEYRFMKIEHLRELVAQGHMVCPHTHSHIILRDIQDKETAIRELVRPKEILEDLLHINIREFAFPVGTERQAGRYAYEYIRQHYDFCFTALNGVNTLKTNRYHLHRDCVPAEAPLSYIKMVMNGTYDLYYRYKMLRLKSIVT